MACQYNHTQYSSRQNLDTMIEINAFCPKYRIVASNGQYENNVVPFAAIAVTLRLAEMDFLSSVRALPMNLHSFPFIKELLGNIEDIRHVC